MSESTGKGLRIAAAVLTGGYSKRMGSPKEDIVIPGDGRTFLDRICDEADKGYPEIISGRYLSVRKGQKTGREGYLRTEDLYDGIGPMGGIISVLTRAKKEGFDAVLFLACDLIDYRFEEMKKICECYRGEDVLFARTDGRDLQPLASIYSISAIPAFYALIEKKNYRIRDVKEILRVTGFYDSEVSQCYVNQNIPF